VNTSKAKMLFSFSKSPKDIYIKKSDCSVAFYDLPDVRATRTAGFGYGHKSDFTKNVPNNPPPNTYEIKSAFEAPKKKGYSFGLSRELMLITGAQFIGEKSSPGPAAYDTRELNKTMHSYSFRPRTTIESLTSPKYVPGPGTYVPAPSLNDRGRYLNSKFKNSCATLFSPPRSKRFEELKPGYPGPGTYENPPSIKEDGSYFVSKFRSSFCRTFSHSIRKNPAIPSFSNGPGPGSYKLPSEFGHYEAAKVDKSAIN